MTNIDWIEEIHRQETEQDILWLEELSDKDFDLWLTQETERQSQ